MTKTQTTILVDDEAYADFKAAVTRRYGAARGHMFDEWNTALKNRTTELERQTKRIRATNKKDSSTAIFGPEDSLDD